MSKWTFGLPSIRLGGSPNEDEIRKQAARRCVEIAEQVADESGPVGGVTAIAAGQRAGAFMVMERIRKEFNL